ncbi:MAG: 5'-nucleotidase C-terminal domain-containing protein [Chitinophagaceae bacterium]|nr:5'-nucleotidase C-terminal domain-containing protein [Chitinophagaceae bacterium]
MRRNYSLRIFAALLLLITVFSCNTVYQSQSLQHKSYRIGVSQVKDTATQQMLHPYTVKVNETMNEVVGVADMSLDKTQPEGTLGNFMVDALYTMAAEKYAAKVDAALVNFGGIRLTQLPAGNVTTGKIFELMPFDNLLILQKLDGKVFQQLLDLMAEKGGWPLAGVTMQIKDKKAVNVMVGESRLILMLYTP